MLASGTRKNFRFFLRSCSFTEREPVAKLISSTFQPCRCIASLRALRRDAYWFSAANLALRRYWSVISDIRLYSRMHNTPALFPIGRWTAIPSGLILQNLFIAIVSLDWPSWTLLDSSRVRGRSIPRVLAAFHIAACVIFRYCKPSISSGISFQIVWRHLSPEVHKNSHSGDANRTSSPWIRRQRFVNRPSASQRRGPYIGHTYPILFPS
jgi:hypothetical protein